MNRISLALAAGAIALGAAGAAQAQSTMTTLTSPDASAGIYVRGSLGYSWSAQDEIDYSPLWGLGVGYRLNRNLRADVTIDWRDRYIVEGDTFDSKIDNKAFMLNVYYDLEQLPVVSLPAGFKPYVGAGVGLSRVEVNDQLITPEDGVFGDDEYNFAWQAMFGVGYQVTPNLSADVGYRYARLGDVQATSPLGDIDSKLNVHEVVLTVRYGF
ncbi:outer membrane protein [Arenibaculum pallidiluteum]|uniref:outer membrane protein n=1 Tax=Arenibaculum pallidiluteum TaxID=2812559 RepID=UPI001A95E9D1|nr:outer membrane protein [Arenibaculum pallidiluteum]